MSNNERLIDTEAQKGLGIFDSLTNPLSTGVGINERMKDPGVADGTKVFFDHLVQYLGKSENEGLKNILMECLASEVAQRAYKKKKNILIKEREKKKAIKTDPKNAGKSDSIILLAIKEIEEAANNEKEQVFKNKQSQFSKSSGTDLWNTLNEIFALKEGKFFEPANRFAFEIYKLFNSSKLSQDLINYLISLIHYCSVWANPNGFKKMPVVYPFYVRKPDMKLQKGEVSQKKIDSNNIDMRGFKVASNPINRIKSYIISTENLETTETQDVKKKGQGQIRAQEKKNKDENPFKSEKVKSGQYKGKSIGSGFEACHIWYDTTRAPPMFTFVPNIVWLPTMISKLSDKVIMADGEKLVGTKENVFARTLREYSRNIYGGSQDLNSGLGEIIKGIWKGLGEQDIVEDWKDITTKKYQHVSKARKNLIMYKGSKRSISACRILVEKIKEYKKKCESLEPSEIETIKRRNKGKPEIFEWYEEYNKDLPTGDNPVHSKKDENSTLNNKKGLFITWLCNKFRDKPEKFRKKYNDNPAPWIKEIRNPRKEKRILKHTNALEELVILSKDECFKDVYDFQTWLENYYKAVLRMKHIRMPKEEKKSFIKQVRSKDHLDNLKQTLGVNAKKDIDWVINDMNIKSNKKKLTNIEDIRAVDPSELKEVFDNIEQEQQKKDETGKDEDEKEGGVEDKAKDDDKKEGGEVEECPPTEKDFNLMDFTQALCNNIGNHTYALKKK